MRFALNDGEGGVSADYDTSITITQQNDAPQVSLSNLVTALNENIDTSAAIRVSDIAITDDLPGTNNLILSGPDAALFEIVGAELRLRAGVSLDFETQSSFQVSVDVDDAGVGGSPDDSQLFTLTLNDINETPTNLVPNDVYLDENIDTTGGLSIGTFTTTDQDSAETFSYAIIGGADAALFSIGGPGGDELILDAGTLNFEVQNTYAVQVQVTDSAGNSIDRTVTVHVNDLNEAPSDITPNAVAIDENTDSSGGLNLTSLLAADEDFGDSHSFMILGGPDAALFTITGAGNDVLTLDDGWLDHERQSSYSVLVRVTDSAGNTYDELLTVSINDINDTPTVVPLGSTVAEGGIDTITSTEMPGADPDNTPTELVYTITTNPGNGFLAFAASPAVPINSFTQAQIDAGAVIYVHDGSETTTDQFVFDLSDGSGGVLAGQVFNLTVTPVNDAPIASGDSYSFNEDTSIASNLLVNDSDAEGSLLTAELVTGPSRAASFSLNSDGSFNYQPNSNYFGGDSFSYRVFDGAAYSNTVTVSLSIHPVNDLARANPDQFSVLQGEFLDSIVSVLSNDSDVENQALTAVIFQQPSNGTLVFQPDGTFLYFPNPGFSGTDTFTYAANDGSGPGNLTTVEILVQAPLPDDNGGGGGGDSLSPEPDADNENQIDRQQQNTSKSNQKVFFLGNSRIQQARCRNGPRREP